MAITKEDHDFLVRQARIKATDLKSLKTQLKAVVRKAQEVVAEQLAERRKRLKTLLETEEQFFQDEFAGRVKNRITEGFKERKKALMSLNEQRKKEKAVFLEAKRMQRQMEECLEFRQEMSKKLELETRECQLHQMLEKEHAIRKERDEKRYWDNVERVNYHKGEDDLKKERDYQRQIMQKNRCQLCQQIEENKFMRRQEELEKIEDCKKMTALRREILLEETARKYRRTSPRSLARGQEQRDDIERRRQQRLAEECELINDHRKLIAEIQQELNIDCSESQRSKDELKKTLLDFIKYMQGVRNHQAEMEKMRDDRTADLHRVDFCTAKNDKLLRKERAAEYFSDLRCQVVEECKKRQREEAEYQDRAIIENRFARDEWVDPMAKTLAQRQYYLDLDQQILETQRVCLEELAAYERLIKNCADNPEDCDNLLEYLDKNAQFHPNWKILACGKNRRREIREFDRKISLQDIPPEGRIETDDDNLKCDCDTKCHMNKKCNFSFVPHQH